LILALEPEAASIFCQYLSTEHLFGVDNGFTVANTGAKYMVVDLGGELENYNIKNKNKVPNHKIVKMAKVTFLREKLRIMCVY